LPLRTLFEAPTIAGLAERIQAAHHAAPAQPIPRVSRDGPLPLSFAQERLWFLHQWQPDSSAYNIPAAVRLSGPLNISAAEQSLNEIVRRHEALRTTFPTVGGQ